MTTNSAAHPEELLEAFALDALEPEEEQAVLEHLEGCMQCGASVEDYLRTAAALALTTPPVEPPAHLRTEILAAIGPDPAAQQPTDTVTRRPVGTWSRVYRGIGSRWGRLLMPVTAGAAVVVAAFVIAANVQMSGEMDDVMVKNSQLQETLDENMATAEAQLALADSAMTEMQGNLEFLQNTLAQPGNRSLVMNPMQAGSASGGVLVLSGDMTAAVVMASGLAPPEGDSGYHVWLMQKGQRTWAGTMEVDDVGWGAMALSMNSGMSQFDSVQLSLGPLNLASVGIVGDIVLEVALP